MFLDLPHDVIPNERVAAWLGSDFVSTLFAMRQLLGITGLPYIVTFVRLMIMSRMTNMSYFIAQIPRWSLSAGNMLPCSHRQDLMMCPLF